MKEDFNKTINYLINHVAVRFIIVGGTAAVFQLTSLYLLHEIIGLTVLISSGIAFIASVLFNFAFQKFWSFKDPSKDKIASQFSFFFLNALGNLIINMLIMFVLVRNLNFNTYLSQAFTLIFIAFFNFFIYKIIFNYKKNHPDAPGAGMV